MANVNQSGNLIVQGADDMAVPHKGIELDFRRTYNSLSQHDYFATDGGQISNYGGGWTNTFDAHLSTNVVGGISVYDIDGARYDYTGSNAGWTPPHGQFAQLTYDGTNGYFWTKKSGTVYYFYGPLYHQIIPYVGFQGRLYKIFGRNNNTLLTFNYQFDVGNNGTSSCALNAINVFEEASQTASATLTFTSVPITVQGSQINERLLSTLLRPDGTVVDYYYDANSGSLAEADMPPHNNPTSVGCHSGANCLPQQYQYTTGQGYEIAAALSPRLVETIAGQNEPSGPAGGETQFVFNSSSPGQINQVLHIGYMNPTPNDGTSTPLQPSIPTGLMTFATDTFAQGSSTTAWSDTDGHSVTYTFDSAAGRVMQRQASTGTTNLTTHQAWDASNNLSTTTDANGKITRWKRDDRFEPLARSEN